MSQKQDQKQIKDHICVVRMTEEDENKYMKIAKGKGISLAALFRVAIDAYCFPTAAPEPRPKNEVAHMQTIIEDRMNSRFDAIESLLKQIPAPTSTNLPVLQQVVEKLEILRKAETSQLVKLLPHLSKKEILDQLEQIAIMKINPETNVEYWEMKPNGK